MFAKKKKSIFLIVASFIFINFIFNFQTFKDLINTQFLGKVYVNDYTITEFVYENLKLSTTKLFYPFQMDLFAFGIGPNISIALYLLFHQLFNPTASIMLVGLTSFWISTFLMFLMLRKMKIEIWVAFIVSIMFGYMPFLSYQVITQFGYIAVYFFPALYLSARSFLDGKDNRSKYLHASLFGIILGVLFYTNLYYFLMSALAIFFYLAYFFMASKKIFLNFVKDNFKFLVISLGVFFIFVFPWIYIMRENKMLDGALTTNGFGGATILSADLISFFTPSQYNPIYSSFVNFLTDSTSFFIKYAKFFFNSSNRFAYPGLIVLLTYFYIVFFKKKLASDLWNKIKPHFFVSIIFASITLGPFLKFMNRWALPLDDGVSLIMPMPFLLLHYLPQFNNIRAPQRFVPIFVFFALIVTAYVLNSIFSKLSKKVKIIFISLLFTIFLFDQFYAIPPRVSVSLPNSIYSYIKNDPEKVSVMEIPFTVRDGMEYIGFVHGLSPIKGSLTHNKPIIGGYLPRINTYVFEYYRQLPFVDYAAKIIDKGNYDQIKEKPGELNIFPFQGDIELANKETDFLDIKYILLKNDEKYTKIIRELAEKIGYKLKLKDGKYDLFEKDLIKINFDEIKFGSINDYLFTAAGWSFREDGYRWAQGKLAKVFIKTNDISKQKLIFEALSFYQPQKVKVYINKKYVGEKEVAIEKGRYIIDINGKLEKGINTVYFVFSKSFVPAELWSHDNDMRDLAVKFFSLKLE